MEKNLAEQYRRNLQKSNRKNPDLRKFKGKVMEGKDLEFFKGLSFQIKNEANNVMADGYNNNSITRIEKLLGDFNMLYNAYYEQIVRNPANKLSQPMRDIVEGIKNTLLQISDIEPAYANRLKAQLNQLDDLNRRTGGNIIKGVPTPSYLSGSGNGTYNGDVSVDVEYYEPTLEERMRAQRFLPLWEDNRYSKLQMNSDYN